MPPPLKILAIQFKSLGDSVLLIPALRAIRQKFPDCALHVLVQEAVVPLLQYEPSITRLWSMLRVRNRARMMDNWPLIRALRAEHFDRSVDFVGNDRGAIVSLLCGARERLGAFNGGGFLGRRFCYTKHIRPAPKTQHETLRSLHVLSKWGITPPDSIEVELRTDPALDAAAAQLLPEQTIICHIGASITKKEWPVTHWAEFYRLASAGGYKLIFNSGASPRELALLRELLRLVPDAPSLSPAIDRATFLAVIKRARIFVSADTGPMHFAACLGVPTLALFGPTEVSQWAPVGKGHQIITSPRCSCHFSAHDCYSATHCMTGIQPTEVFRRLQSLIAQKH
jgi:heptosyltransferase-3